MTYCPLGLFCFFNLLNEGISGLKELTLSRKNWTFLIISRKTSRRVVVLLNCLNLVFMTRYSLSQAL